MNIKTFIDRPIFAGVISVVILLLGLICLVQLPVERFPNIAPPTVTVFCSYSGANAETVQKSVIVPLEEAINGVENMMYMSSTASNSGSARIDVFFRQGTDPDMAAVNVQNRIATAQGLLPAEVTKSGVNVRRRQTSTLKILAVYSPDDSYDATFLNNYFMINLEPQLSRVTGVGEVDAFGAAYSMRIWLRPDKMAQYGLMPSDIQGVLSQQNIETSAGTFGSESDNTFQYVLKYRGRYETDSEFENLVVKSLPDGSLLRIKDIATVELGLQSYVVENTINGHPGVMCMVTQTPGSNANNIIIEIDKLIEQIREELPKGVDIIDLMSTKDFLDESISNVVVTLLEALLLVILVVFVFLQSVKSTLIPAISTVVSLLGTFAFLMVAGFSLNLITLFALVLVIGTVVDNAIVVVEAVQAKFDQGYTSPYRATIDAMGDITTAIIAATLVFMAVFIPVCFMGGTTGVFYKQFGITMAVAVFISAINALTLSPALCALLMTPHNTEGDKLSFSSRFHKSFDAGFEKLVGAYSKIVAALLKRKWVVALIYLIVAGGFVALLYTTKTGLVPAEDMGSLTVTVQTAPGSSIAQTRAVMTQIEQRIKDMPEIKAYSKSSGRSNIGGQGASNGTFSIRLIPWDSRKGKEHSQESVMAEIYRRTADITTARIMIHGEPMISGYGSTNGFELYVQDRKGGSVEDLLGYTRLFIDSLSRRPEIGRAQTTFDTKYPQYLMEVDAAKCMRAGVKPTDVLSTISVYVGGNYSSNINRFSKLYRVMLQAGVDSRLDKESLNDMYVRSSSGEMSSVAQYVTLKKVYGSENLTRFNLFSAIRVNGMPAQGYSSGQALGAIKQCAHGTLPAGYSYEFSGMSREEAGQGNTAVLIYAICIIFIYLILCALYESLLIPFVVILSVPFGLAGSFLFAKIFGIENNIYMQTGMIMLIGLLSKTAILLTEYASERRREGMSVEQAAMASAKARLRPILMTSLTMIFGLLPMMFASGAGANGNISLAVGAVGGMLLGTVGLLLVTPAVFIVFQNIEEKIMPRRKAE